AFLLPIIILGGIFGGVVTATEGAALAVVAALAVGLLIYRELNLGHLKQAIIEGATQTAVVMLLVATSALLGTYLTEVQAPQKLAHAVSEMTRNKWLVLALLNVLFLLLGMFLHSAAAIILVVPVVMPLVKAVGIDPVHFGLIVTVNLGIGQQTPPVASVLMVASANKAQAIVYGAAMHETARSLAACRHPLVAQIHGVCVGGGLEIAALCDLRICGTSSRFGAPIKNLGLVMAYAEMAPLIDLV